MCTVVTVFLITVIHTVEHIVTAPSFRDAVSMVTAEELIFSALFYTVHLVRDQKRDTKIIRQTLSMGGVHLIVEEEGKKMEQRFHGNSESRTV